MTKLALELSPPDAPLEHDTLHGDVPAAPALPGLTGAAVFTAPEVLRSRLATYSASRAILLEWINSNLIAGVDYQLIHRKVGDRGNKRDCPKKLDVESKRCTECGGKATLCKPGAEKICGLLRLRPQFRKDQETWDMLGGTAGTVALVCELVDESSVIVAEGRGARRKEDDYGDVNKTIKMCQKSAQGDAVLRCAGLSEVFTQDADDGEPKKRRVKADPPPPKDPPAPTEPTITELQAADIDTLLRSAGRSEGWALKKLGYGARLEDIRASDFARVCDGIRKAGGLK